MPHRVLTPDSHGDETMKIAHDMLPDGLELVTAPHGRPEFWNLLKDADFYIGAGQFKHGPEFYQQAPKLKPATTLMTWKRRVPRGCRSATMAAPTRPLSPSTRSC
jgi:hypothetical protein